LFVYAVGRTPGVDDAAEIETIMTDLRSKDYPLRDLVKAVVRSRAFLEQYGDVVEPRIKPAGDHR
jgi:hypothetical protein